MCQGAALIPLSLSDLRCHANPPGARLQVTAAHPVAVEWDVKKNKKAGELPNRCTRTCEVHPCRKYRVALSSRQPRWRSGSKVEQNTLPSDARLAKRSKADVRDCTNSAPLWPHSVRTVPPRCYRRSFGVTVLVECCRK